MTNLAKKVLSQDKRMARLIEKHGAAPIGGRPLFLTFARAIVSQMLSVQAAKTILDGIERRVGLDPVKLSRVRPTTLRGLGLSQAKSACMKEVARLTVKGAFDDLPDLSDDEVRERLLAIKGIGPWTAQIVLLFALGRPDIWPVGDVGIQRAAYNLYKVDGDRLEKLGEEDVSAQTRNSSIG